MMLGLVVGSVGEVWSKEVKDIKVWVGNQDLP